MVGQRIIPARAGFTDALVTLWHGARDHPRSRGVYRSKRSPTTTSGGSSPLARGLQSANLVPVLTQGIIPARAGFTPPPFIQLWDLRDHPRSRGVYTGAAPKGRQISGSSPLARGLLAGAAVRAGGGGIIPARAGFTPTTRAPSGRAAGSSPLARGLRRGMDGHPHLLRIIPARAGFTPTRSPAPRATPDHPRSRGVYPGALAAARSRPGSSPLARGLRLAHGGGTVLRGIIPARAGFTS